MIKSLPIKKKYLEEIRDGKKIYEYREDKRWFDWLKNDEIKYISLHYYSDNQLLVRIENKKLIPIPDNKRKFFPKATHLWEIEVNPYFEQEEDEDD